MRTDVGTIGVGCAYNPDSTHGHHGTQDFGGAPPPLVDGVPTPMAPDLGTVLRGTWVPDVSGR